MASFSSSEDGRDLGPDSDSDSDSDSGSDDHAAPAALYSAADVLGRIEEVTLSLVEALHGRSTEPVLATPRSVRWTSAYCAGGSGRRRRISSGGSSSGSEMDDEDIYGGRIVRPAATRSTTTSATAVTKSLNLHQCRSYTSVLLVLSFVQGLLRSRRTSTTREVYYHFVTHFRSQRECDAAIWDAAALLRVPRGALGLAASPRGWFCGCVEIVRRRRAGGGDGADEDDASENENENTSSRVDGTALSSVQGLPITREWIDRSATPTATAKSRGGSGASPPPFQFEITSRNAKCILVIEKEGVYNRLSEDRFFDRCPSILVTGKGYPDLATRALVHALHTELRLPVYGLCDCNPHGIGVLQTYRRGSARMGLDGADRYGVPIQWIGLRPSQVCALRSSSSSSSSEGLPPQTFQSLTALDRKKISRLAEEGSAFVSDDGITSQCRRYRRQELALMEETGVKAELESLHWLGMGYMCKWLERIVLGHEKAQAQLQLRLQEEEEEEEGDEDDLEDSEEEMDSSAGSIQDDDDDDEDDDSSSLDAREEMIRSLSCVCII